jgi:D-glycero-alpha-D-manno-heptose-7-phosphate kinase
MIISKTPFRLSFFGGGTDYRPWFEENGGLIIASAIARYCYITLRELPPFFDHKTRAVYSKIESVISNDEVSHPSIRNCLKHLNIQEGLEIHHDGDLPARSGTGSSSSFTVGLLNALHAFKYEMCSSRQLADEAIYVEQNLIKENVGIQDQIMAAHGGLQLIKMGPGPDYSVSPLIIAPDYLKALEEHILLGFSGVSRYSEKYAKAQVDNINNGSSNGKLREMQSIAEEALALFQKQANLDEIGDLLDKSWQLKQQLAENLSNRTLNGIYEIAKKNGAFGGKLSGAGGGGFFWFLAPPYRHEKIKSELKNINVWVPFKIDKAGSQIIFHSIQE